MDEATVNDGSPAIMGGTPQLEGLNALLHEAVRAMDNGNNLVVMPEMLEAAESRLASYIGNRINPILTRRLEMTLQSRPSVDGTTDLVLLFRGPMVIANGSLLTQQALVALRGHPALAEMLDSLPQPPRAQKTPHTSRNEVEVHIPGLMLSQYASLVQVLSGQYAPTVTDQTKIRDISKEPMANAHVSGCACASCVPVAASAAAHTVGCACSACMTTPDTKIGDRDRAMADRTVSVNGVSV